MFTPVPFFSKYLIISIDPEKAQTNERGVNPSNIRELTIFLSLFTNSFTMSNSPNAQASENVIILVLERNILAKSVKSLKMDSKINDLPFVN